WCTLRGFNKDTQRAVIQNFNLSVLSVTMAIYLATGIVTRDMAPMFAVVAPAMLIPTLLGTRLYIGISDVTFRRVVLGLLTCSGLT
ncbi:sulfite exporter TauE/SafE family protein, partial [Pseudomonas aeruginosa]